MKKLFIIATLLGMTATCLGAYNYNDGPRRDRCYHRHCRCCRKDGKPAPCRRKHRCRHYRYCHHCAVKNNS